MVEQKDVTIIARDAIPVGKVIGKYTFLKDMGKTLEKEQAIQINTSDPAEAKKIQNRWRAYFKGTAHSRRDVQQDGKIVLFLWLD